MSSRTVTRVAVGLVVVAALVPLGRWEAARSQRVRNDGIARVRADIGSELVNRQLSGYRIARPVDCLLYRWRSILYRWELCYASDGRLIEAIDRRSEPARVWSLREQPAAARMRVPASQLYRIFRSVGAFAGEQFNGSLPTAYEAGPPSLIAPLDVILAIGPDLKYGVDGYRLTPHYACLEYRSVTLEVCFERSGRLVRAAEPGHHVFYRSSRANAPARARPRTVFEILRLIGALPSRARFTGALPTSARPTRVVRTGELPSP